MWIQIEPEEVDRRGMEYVRERIAHYVDSETEDTAKYRAAAQEASREGECEVDDNAVVSEGDDPGAYVMAWVWVTAQEAGVELECPYCGEKTDPENMDWPARETGFLKEGCPGCVTDSKKAVAAGKKWKPKF